MPTPARRHFAAVRMLLRYAAVCLVTACAMGALARPATAQTAVALTVNDTVKVADSVAVLPPVNVYVSEPVKVIDGELAQPPANLVVSDAVTVGDSVAIRLPVNLVVQDTVSVADSVAVLPPVDVYVQEPISVSDSVAVVPPVNLTVHDAVTVSDSVAVRPPVDVYVQEPISVSDSVVVLPPVNLTVHDAVTVSDSVAVLPPVNLIIHDRVTARDTAFFPTEAPAEADTITAGLVTSGVQTLLGDPADLPLMLDMTKSPDAVRIFVVRMTWDTTKYSYEGVQNGTFASVLHVNTSKLDSGVVEVGGIRKSGFTRGTVKLLTLALRPKPGDAPGSKLPVGLSFIGLVNTHFVDVSSAAQIQPAALCVGTRRWGDVTGDGKVAIADVVQVLRHLLGMPTASGVDVTYGDVDGDGRLTAADAVQMLRFVVGLSVPKDSRVGRFEVTGCGTP